MKNMQFQDTNRKVRFKRWICHGCQSFFDKSKRYNCNVHCNSENCKSKVKVDHWQECWLYGTMQYCCPIDDTDPPPRNHRNSNVTLNDEASTSAEDMMSEDAIGVAWENCTALQDDLNNNLQSGPSSFPRAALLTTLRVCVRIWDGVGFGVRVSEIKATNLIMLFVSHRVVP